MQTFTFRPTLLTNGTYIHSLNVFFLRYLMIIIIVIVIVFLPSVAMIPMEVKKLGESIQKVGYV